jgi:glycosyltransferase involved in cell wall biosynthesis
MALCDCYVSLHRSEGLGLTMAEAMGRGKPVIATGYSGNMDFTNEENSYLVNYSLVPIGPHHEPYPSTQKWADPDLEHAARLLRHVYENRAEAAAKGRRGAEVIAQRYSIDSCSRFLVERLSHANSWARLGWHRRQLNSLRRHGVPRQLRDRAVAASRTLW